MEDHCGYLIVLVRISDPERFRNYVRALPPVFQKFGGRYLSVCPASQVATFGAAAPDMSVMISVWPSLERIQQFWTSIDYQTVRELRSGTGEFHVLAIDGETTEGPCGAIVLGLEPGEPLESDASQQLFTSDALRIIGSAGMGEGTLLEGQRAAVGLTLATAANVDAARKVLQTLPSDVPLRALLLPGLR
jgi:uncharacterized protein (DUF1330 family)